MAFLQKVRLRTGYCGSAGILGWRRSPVKTPSHAATLCKTPRPALLQWGSHALQSRYAWDRTRPDRGAKRWEAVMTLKRIIAFVAIGFAAAVLAGPGERAAAAEAGKPETLSYTYRFT